MKPPRTRVKAAAAIAALALLVGALPGCDSGGSSASGGQRLQVMASFYPVQYLLERLGGDQVRVSTLTRPGAEPHDLELTPQDLVRLQRSDLLVYLKGFQPAVDAAAESAGAATLDAAPSAQLHTVAGGKAPDPHFWLDPTRMIAVATAVEQRLSELRPAAAAGFRTRLSALRQDLTALDAAYRSGLASCADRRLVTSHRAFDYLARRYQLQPLGITGLAPQSEPGPSQLAAVIAFARTHHVRTIYSETLLSPAASQAVARDSGAGTAVLDPVESLGTASDGDSYLAVMRSNLDVLRRGQGCR